MGTKAVFAVGIGNGKICRTIIGMTIDGFPSNLEYLGNKFLTKSVQLRVEQEVYAGDCKAIQKVL